MRKSPGILAVAILALGLASVMPTGADAQPMPPLKGGPGAGPGGPGPGGPPPGPIKKKKSNAGKIGAGIAAGVVGAIILNEALKAQESKPKYSCRSLSRMCDEGERWACRRYDDQCE